MQRQLLIAAIAVGSLAITSSGVRGAGASAGDESAIRKLIAAIDAPGGNTTAPRLADEIFWSGAYKRPFITPEKGEPLAAASGATLQDRVAGSQKSKTEPVRIVVADSHDLAYEYSKSTLEFDLKNGEHRSIDTGMLRVWQKQNGDWKIAAMFSRPYDVGFAAQ